MKPFNIRGTKYRFVVLKVTEKDALGRPKKAELLYDEESTQLEGGEEFEIVAMREDATRQVIGAKA